MLPSKLFAPLLLSLTLSLLHPSVQCEPFPSSALRLPTDRPDPASLASSSPTTVPKTCPVTCFVPDPVCGEDGTTYWCGSADAACSGVRVAKEGFCAVGSGGNGLLPGQAFLLVHIVWLIVLGFAVVFGLF